MLRTETLTGDAFDIATASRGRGDADAQAWWLYGLLQLVDYYQSALAREDVRLAASAFEREPVAVSPRIDASVASAAEHLADRDGWPAPRWAVRRPALSEDWFVDGIPAFYDLQRAESPLAFARRRIFVFANALERA